MRIIQKTGNLIKRRISCQPNNDEIVKKKKKLTQKDR